MTKISALVGVVILSAVVATPIFAQDAAAAWHRSHNGQRLQAGHHGKSFQGAYNSRQPNIDELQFRRNKENFGFSGRDHSRVGGEDPALHPLPN